MGQRPSCCLTRSLVLALTVGLTVASTTTTPAQAQTAEQEQQALRTYQEGVELANQKRWAEAAGKFEEVVKVRAATPVLFALAEAQSHTSELVAAKHNYQRAIEMAGSEYAEVAQQARTSLAKLDPRLPRLTLRFAGDVPNARVMLDGADVSNPAEPIELDPGKAHVLAITAPGHQAFRASVKLGEGEQHELPVDLRRSSPATAVEPAAPAPAHDASFDNASFVDEGATEEPSSKPLPLGPLVLGGAGAVATVVGIVIRTSGKGAYDDAAGKCDQAPVCDDPSVVSDGNDARDRMVLGTAIAGVGVAALTGAGAWWLLARDDRTQQAALRLNVAPTAGGGFARVQGTF